MNRLRVVPAQNVEGKNSVEPNGEQPRFSIVTPSFNQSRYVEDALLSVKEQNYPWVQHIVVDGASTDGTVGILKRYATTPGWEHLRWISEPDRGQSDALNKGLLRAQGDIIGWLNSDDRYRPGCFREVAVAFERYPAADVLYGDYACIDENNRFTQVRREIEFSRFILLYHRVLYIPSTATFFRRRIFDDGNSFDLSLANDMDYEFFLRVAQKGYRFRHLPKLLADFRWHPKSKSSTLSRPILQQHDLTAERYSPTLRKLPAGFPRKAVFLGLRALAAALRYSEKLLRGYYFTPSSLDKQQ
jgi:glycosyltransferase involved in cell wall biosynthesis